PVTLSLSAYPTLFRSEDDLLVAPGNPHVDQLVPLIQLDCADPALADVLEFREAGPFDSSPFGHEDEESVWGELSSRNHRFDLLIDRKSTRLNSSHGSI